MDYILQVCHICLKVDANLQNMFSLDDEMVYLRNAFEVCIPEIQVENNVPFFICKSCGEVLRNFNEFRQLCVKNITNLRKCFFEIKRNPDVKVNDQLNSVLADITREIESCMMEGREARENIAKYASADSSAEQYLYKNGDRDVFIKQEQFEFDELASKFNIGHFMTPPGDFYNNGIDINISKEGDGKDAASNGQSAKRSRRKVRERHMCQYCNKCFSTVSYLRMHTRTHTGQEPYVCGTCNKGFVRPSSLKVHRVTHTHEKPYACSTCGKAFARPSDLTRHKRTHTGEKRFACNICHKRFTETGSLHTHTRIHTGETPYVCNLCDKRFPRLDHLKKHRRTTHQSLTEQP